MMETIANHLIFFSSLVFVVYAQYGIVIPSDDPTTGFTRSNVTLECQQTVRTGVAPDLSWEFPQGKPIVTNSKYIVIVKKNESARYTESTLIIKDGRLADNGRYYCLGESASSYVEVLLSLDAEVTIINVSGDFLLAKGTTMLCKSDGPNATVTWSKDDQLLKEGKHDLDDNKIDDLEVNKENELELLSADPVLGGLYICTADLGSTTKSVSQIIAGELDVFAPKSIKVSEGEDGRMECRVTSIPMATVTWFVNDTKIMGGDKYVITAKDSSTEEHQIISTLRIRKVSLEDGKPTNYTCSATNGLYTTDEIIILRIRDRLAALWPFIGIVSEVIILIIIILIHEACTKGEDIGEVEDEEEDHLLQKGKTITRDGDRETRMRGTNN